MDIITLALAKKIAEEKALAATENLLENVYTKTAIDELASEKADLVDGKVPASQLPSYVDDVLEFNTLADFPATGESGKIYVAKDTNKTYRWGGSGYVEISASLALGETSSTAYRGDRGKTAYDHSQLVADNPHNTTKSMIGLGNVDNTSDTNKPISTATQTALNLKADLVEGKVPVEQLPAPVVPEVEYDGASTTTADTTVNNIDKTIEVDVIKVPHVLTILDENTNVTSTFDGSADVNVTINSGVTLRTIASSTDKGKIGEFCYDADYLYICVATDTWKRVALDNWQ